MEVQFKQRAFDGKWEKIGRILDHENAYTFTNENGNKTTLIPEKWVTLAVYDYELFFEE